LAAAAAHAALAEAVAARAEKSLAEAYRITEKQQRQTRLSEIKQELKEALSTAVEPAHRQADAVVNELFKLESRIVRERILAGEPRIDGRDMRTVRPITVKVGVLPRTHGSALFTRGETQALVTTTLWARRATPRSSTRSRASGASRSCCIIISRRSRWARPA
jgi:polyribonucleotide nucleotidyltransferase